MMNQSTFHYNSCLSMKNTQENDDAACMQIDNAIYDGAYAIEATCHAPDIRGCFHEIYRVLKPGTFFACYEWCLTNKYDETKEDHRRIKQDIQLGNGIPELRTCEEVVRALKVMPEFGI